MYQQYYQEIKRQNGSFNRRQLTEQAKKLASKEARLVCNKLSQSQIDRFARDLIRFLHRVPDPLQENINKIYEKAFDAEIKEQVK